jgi:hypothetical protein
VREGESEKLEKRVIAYHLLFSLSTLSKSPSAGEKGERVRERASELEREGGRESEREGK